MARPFSVPTPQVVRSARPVPIPVGWPVGPPPPPFRVQQLWGLDGTGGESTVEEMIDWVRRGSAALREVAGGGHPAGKVEGMVWLRDLMPDWTVGGEGAPISWDARDPEDCCNAGRYTCQRVRARRAAGTRDAGGQRVLVPRVARPAGRDRLRHAASGVHGRG